MQEADLVLVVGRKLDYQMAYGSPVVFKRARFVRIADHADELRDNRRGEVELLADPALALDALASALGAVGGARHHKGPARCAPGVKRAAKLTPRAWPSRPPAGRPHAPQPASSPRCARCWP